MALRILLADEDATHRKQLEEQLQKLKYRVEVATSGSQVWDRLQEEHPPRIVIYSLKMRGLSGRDLSSRLLSLGRPLHTYLIVLHDKVQSRALQEALDAGADDYMIKPVDADDLRARLKVARRVLALHERLRLAQETVHGQFLTDSLTDIWSRDVVVDFLDRELARTRRSGATVALVMVDLDGFKQINEQHGLQVGDAVLRDVARRLQGSLRISDGLGRYGSDEFLLVLTDCTAQQAKGKASRVQRTLSAHPVHSGSLAINVSASIGIAAASGTAVGPQDLLRDAVEALGQARAKGPGSIVTLAGPAAARG